MFHAVLFSIWNNSPGVIFTSRKGVGYYLIILSTANDFDIREKMALNNCFALYPQNPNIYPSIICITYPRHRYYMQQVNFFLFNSNIKQIFFTLFLMYITINI